MKTYLKEVPSSDRTSCLSRNGEECHYFLKCRKSILFKRRCKFNTIVFIKVDPEKVIEYYEREVKKISKNIDKLIDVVCK